MTPEVKIYFAVLATALNAGLATDNIFVGLAVGCGCMFLAYLVEAIVAQ